MIEAVIFDFDGLILQTEMPIFVAWQEEFAAHGGEPLTVEEWSAEIGTVGGLDVVALLHERATQPVDEAVMHERRRARYLDLIALEQAQPGVAAWLDEADEMGLRVAIASSSRQEWIEPQLVRLGLRDRFEVLSCYGEGISPKPEPDSYLAACAALGVEPAGALAVEDSPNGVRAAKAAGLRCVVVPHAITEMLDLSEADLRLASLADVSLRDAISRVEALR
jgi:HAD superfamily hydrolase (TIGR01509 family)